MSIEIKRAHTEAERAQCLAIRMTVFVHEQQVPAELELDEYDGIATHLLLTEDGRPLATARLVDKYGVAKIGRVAVAKDARGQGLGLRIMQAVLEEARGQGFTEAMLDSQSYAIPFYEKLGFVAEGEEFDDAGIPHRLMRRGLGNGKSVG